MAWRIICALVALIVLTNAQQSGRQHGWSPSDDFIDIDADTADTNSDIDTNSEMDANSDIAINSHTSTTQTDTDSYDDQWWDDDYEEISGSGSGADYTDDEDVFDSDSGSGDGELGFSDTALYTTKPITTTSGTDDTDDEDVFDSDFGSGAGEPEFSDKALDTGKPTTTTTTKRPLPPCQEMRQITEITFGDFYVPQCNSEGDYSSLQCRGHQDGTDIGTCWCADLNGREIPGTAWKLPDVPDCDGGSNLPPCVFQLVQQSRRSPGQLLGSYRPQCTQQGDFESTQCWGSVCYCVDTKTGEKVPGTEVSLPERPECDGQTTTPRPPVDDDDQTPRETPSKTMTGGSSQQHQDTHNQTESSRAEPMKQSISTSTVESSTTQPWVLVVTVGGSAVLLCVGLLATINACRRRRRKRQEKRNRFAPGDFQLETPIYKRRCDHGKTTPRSSNQRGTVQTMPKCLYKRAPEEEFYV